MDECLRVAGVTNMESEDIILGSTTRKETTIIPKMKRQRMCVKDCKSLVHGLKSLTNKIGNTFLF